MTEGWMKVDGIGEEEVYLLLPFHQPSYQMFQTTFSDGETNQDLIEKALPQTCSLIWHRSSQIFEMCYI